MGKTQKNFSLFLPSFVRSRVSGTYYTPLCPDAAASHLLPFGHPTRDGEAKSFFVETG